MRCRLAIRVSVLAFVACCAVGCTGHDHSQEYWNNRLWALRMGLIEIYRNEAEPLSPGQFCSLAGARPDYVVVVEELPAFLAKQVRPGKHSSFMEMSYRSYQLIHGKEPFVGPSWMKNQSFRKCKVWIYDESRHFEKSSGDGFAMYLFLIEDSKVIDGTGRYWPRAKGVPPENSIRGVKGQIP